jgi:hypothetical protein
MAAHLLRCDGLFLGSSAAMNCVGAVKARPVPPPARRACGLWPRPLLAAAQPCDYDRTNVLPGVWRARTVPQAVRFLSSLDGHNKTVKSKVLQCIV